MKIAARRSDRSSFIISLEDGTDEGFIYCVRTNRRSITKHMDCFVSRGYWYPPKKEDKLNMEEISKLEVSDDIYNAKGT